MNSVSVIDARRDEPRTLARAQSARLHRHAPSRPVATAARHDAASSAPLNRTFQAHPFGPSGAGLNGISARPITAEAQGKTLTPGPQRVVVIPPSAELAALSAAHLWLAQGRASGACRKVPDATASTPSPAAVCESTRSVTSLLSARHSGATISSQASVSGKANCAEHPHAAHSERHQVKDAWAESPAARARPLRGPSIWAEESPACKLPKSGKLAVRVAQQPWSARGSDQAKGSGSPLRPTVAELLVHNPQGWRELEPLAQMMMDARMVAPRAPRYASARGYRRK